jgi:hypothetical protein
MGLLSLRSATAPGEKWAGQRRTMSMTRSISLGVSLTATSPATLGARANSTRDWYRQEKPCNNSLRLAAAHTAGNFVRHQRSAAWNRRSSSITLPSGATGTFIANVKYGFSYQLCGLIAEFFFASSIASSTASGS